jgi:uncharacterized protein with GYD domain
LLGRHILRARTIERHVCGSSSCVESGGGGTRHYIQAWTKEVAMPTYVTLIHYTEQGVKAFKDLPQRLEETRKAGEAVGAKLVSFYLTMGQYDAVVVSDAPDDQTVAKLALAAAGRGNVRTETLRAFTEDEARSIAADL